MPLADNRQLADSIIVMKKGKMVAAGTPLHLKAAHGYGSRLVLTSFSDPEHAKPPVDSAVFESRAVGRIVWRIEDASDLDRAVRWAAAAAENAVAEIQEQGTTRDVSIQSWELTMPTLEDVLLEQNLI